MSDRDWDVSDAMLFSLSDVRSIINTLSNNFKQLYDHVDVHVGQDSYISVENEHGDQATVYLMQFGTATLELGLDEPVRLTFRTGTSINDVIHQLYTTVLSHVPADHALTGNFRQAGSRDHALTGEFRQAGRRDLALTGEFRQAGRRDLALTGELRQAGRRDLPAVLRSLHARLERLESAASP